MIGFLGIVTTLALAALIAFIGLIAWLNAILAALGGLVGFPQLSMQLTLAWLFAPVSFVIQG